jgi:hypothetical protein
MAPPGVWRADAILQKVSCREQHSKVWNVANPSMTRSAKDIVRPLLNCTRLNEAGEVLERAVIGRLPFCVEAAPGKFP